jgi:hypothetical protein
VFIFKRPSIPIKKNTASQNDALAKLNAFLNAASPQLVYFLGVFQKQPFDV